MHAVITGSTSGLGTEVARQLKNMGWNLTPGTVVLMVGSQGTVQE